MILTALAPTSGTTADAGPGAAGTGPFTATTLAGQQVNVPGGKPSAVLFFSATCGTCGPAAHALATAQQSNPAANYIAVDLDPTETPADIARFLGANQEVTQLSTAIVLGPDGHVVSRVVEPTAAQIQTALSQAGGA